MAGPHAQRLLEGLIAMAATDPSRVRVALTADPLRVGWGPAVGDGAVPSFNASSWECPPAADRLWAPSSASQAGARPGLGPWLGGGGPSAAALAAVRRGDNGTAVWFDHLSKGGGTTLCALAKAEYGRNRCPRRACMPRSPPGWRDPAWGDDSLGKQRDARIGRWPNRALRRYLTTTGYRFVANEWEPFPAARLLDAPRGLADTMALLTVIRDPLNRLLSAFRQWAHKPKSHNSPAAVAAWLRKADASARQYPILSNIRHFNRQVGRKNFATWKFSAASTAATAVTVAGGFDPRNGTAFDDCQRWLELLSGGASAARARRDQHSVHGPGPGRELHFQNRSQCEAAALRAAIGTLTRFHLVAIMELYDHAPTMFDAVFGWHGRANALTHRRGSYDQVNENADTAIARNMHELLPAAEYEQLFDDNIFDALLYVWARRVFLERLACRNRDSDAAQG